MFTCRGASSDENLLAFWKANIILARVIETDGVVSLLEISVVRWLIYRDLSYKIRVFALRDKSVARSRQVCI
jgi:hypothetical protein